MVRAKKSLYTGLLCKLNARTKCAMPPSDLAWVLCVGVGAVGDQDIDACNGIPDHGSLFIDKTLVFRMLRVIGVVDVVWRLMIAGKEYRFAMALDPVAKIDNRVVQQEWSNGGRSNLYGFARDQRFIFNPGFDFCLPDGKVAILQLDRHDLFNSFARHRVKGSVQSQTVARYEVRDKKW